MERLLVFDLETQYLADEVGGWDHIRDMRLAVGVTYSPTEDLYRVYTEAEVEQLIADLLAAEKVVGYNLYRFDYEVLRAYTRQRLDAVPTVDMLRDLAGQLGWRPRLEDVAAATLGMGKSADGQGRLDLVADYCKRDVEVTWRVYDYGQQNGYVKVLDRSWRERRVPVRW